jgi:hypothetical protein
MATDLKQCNACAVTDGDTILATGHVAMPPERVFNALTTHEVEHWWGASDIELGRYNGHVSTQPRPLLAGSASSAGSRLA